MFYRFPSDAMVTHHVPVRRVATSGSVGLLTWPRWFAYISPSEPCLLEDVLVTPVGFIFLKLELRQNSNMMSSGPFAREAGQ